MSFSYIVVVGQLPTTFTICGICPAGWSFQPVTGAECGYTPSPAKTHPIIYNETMHNRRRRPSIATAHRRRQERRRRRAGHTAGPPHEPHTGPQEPPALHPIPSTAGAQEAPQPPPRWTQRRPDAGTGAGTGAGAGAAHAGQHQPPHVVQVEQVEQVDSATPSPLPG